MTIDNRGTFYDAVFTGHPWSRASSSCRRDHGPNHHDNRTPAAGRAPCPYPTALNSGTRVRPARSAEVGTPAVEVRPIVIAFTG